MASSYFTELVKVMSVLGHLVMYKNICVANDSALRILFNPVFNIKPVEPQGVWAASWFQTCSLQYRWWFWPQTFVARHTPSCLCSDKSFLRNFVKVMQANISLKLNKNISCSIRNAIVYLNDKKYWRVEITLHTMLKWNDILKRWETSAGLNVLFLTVPSSVCH